MRFTIFFFFFGWERNCIDENVWEREEKRDQNGMEWRRVSGEGGEHMTWKDLVEGVGLDESLILLQIGKLVKRGVAHFGRP